MNRYVLIRILSIVLAVISQLLLKISANIKYKSVIKEYLNSYVIIGYGLLFVSMVLSVISLKGMTISYASIIESFSYILIPISSYLYLKEVINKKQIIGMIIIVLGIIIYNI